MNLIEKVFGTHSERELKLIRPIVDKILGMREQMVALSDDELRDNTRKFKERLANGETLDDLLPVIIIIRVAENHTPAIFAARLIDRTRHIGKIYIGNIRDDKSYGLALPLYQTDRELVRTIIQFPRLR